MGFFQAQRAKTDARITAALEGRLEPGEEAVTAYAAITRFPFLLWAVGLLPLAIYLDVEHGIGPAWVAGPSLAVLWPVFVRVVFVVLTDRRLVVLKLRPMSSKIVASEHAAPRSAVAATYREAPLNGFVKLWLQGKRLDLQVAKPFRDRAHSVASHLNPPAAPSER